MGVFFVVLNKLHLTYASTAEKPKFVGPVDSGWQPHAGIAGFHILSAPNIHPTKPRGRFQEVPSRERENMRPILWKKERHRLKKYLLVGDNVSSSPGGFFIDLVGFKPDRFGVWEVVAMPDLGGWQLNYFFIPTLGKMNPILTVAYFFRWGWSKPPKPDMHRSSWGYYLRIVCCFLYVIGLWPDLAGSWDP